MIIPEKYRKEVEKSLEEHTFIDVWQELIAERRIHIKMLVPTEQTSNILDFLEKRFSSKEDFRIILLPVEASIPRPEQPDKLESDREWMRSIEKPEKKKPGVSREELYADVERTTKFSWTYIVLIILSSLVASIGILRNNVVFIIGAMVIAPALGPNVALSLASTLGDIDLTRKATKAIAVGVLTALLFSSVLGLFLQVDTEIPELISRTKVSLGDVVLALAAGSAAAISFTSGLLSALIGVMVAVALLPPLVTLGMLIGSGNWELALGSLLLFLTNLICINLSGVVTFLIQGIRPLTWWEKEKAKKAIRNAIFLWSILLMALVLIIIFS
jgi:uncharacterized hydrophobic protein (TIGR00341 family)